MEPKIITVNQRGGITIPKKDLEALGTRNFTYVFVDDSIVLTPVKTREEFLAELDAAEKEWEEEGGYTLEEMEEKYGL